MYREHAPVIGLAMRSDPEIFKRGCVFVICSIRQRIDGVPGQMQEIDERRAEASCLFGWKRSAYREMALAHFRRRVRIDEIRENLIEGAPSRRAAYRGEGI